MHISEFDYELPEELIAQEPLSRRDASRMLVLERSKASWLDANFASFPEYLRSNDVLVINDTRVLSARLTGNRVPSGGAIELLLLREIGPQTWECLTRPARRLQSGARISLGDARILAEVVESRDNGIRLIKFESSEPFETVIDEIGRPPLPPYIKRSVESADRNRYQTIYAAQPGAIAAPTAGLHFSCSILESIEQRGVTIARITLHVGYGTFEPVRVQEVSRHSVAEEYFSINAAAAETINAARKRGGRVVVVGTTTTRALESSVSPAGMVLPQSGLANLTIVPGYGFHAVDAMLTNFHLPRSSLLLLVSAFAGRELTLKAYRHAVDEHYRFYSYGDCMLIV